MNNKKIMSSVFEKISNGKEVSLESQKIELGLVEDILSDVNANYRSRSAYRKLIRQVRTDLAAAFGHLENIKKRDERIDKQSKSFKKKVDELGVANGLKNQQEYIYKGLYTDKSVDKDMAANNQALKAVLKSSEV